MARKEDLRVGMSITFGQPGGEMTDAVITKINKKNVKVQTCQPRGSAPAGAMWNVAPGLITIVNGAAFNTPSEKEVMIDRIRGLMAKHNISLTDLSTRKGA